VHEVHPEPAKDGFDILPGLGARNPALTNTADPGLIPRPATSMAETIYSGKLDRVYRTGGSTT